jgi:hypothetical protein
MPSPSELPIPLVPAGEHLSTTFTVLSQTGRHLILADLEPDLRESRSLRRSETVFIDNRGREAEASSQSSRSSGVSMCAQNPHPLLWIEDRCVLPAQMGWSRGYGIRIQGSWRRAVTWNFLSSVSDHQRPGSGVCPPRRTAQPGRHTFDIHARGGRGRSGPVVNRAGLVWWVSPTGCCWRSSSRSC